VAPAGHRDERLPRRQWPLELMEVARAPFDTVANQI
jgi:hypothetical protein